jgi:hypothetical protein
VRERGGDKQRVCSIDHKRKRLFSTTLLHENLARLNGVQAEAFSAAPRMPADATQHPSQVYRVTDLTLHRFVRDHSTDFVVYFPVLGVAGLAEQDGASQQYSCC